MSTRVRRAKSNLGIGLRARANALLLILALGTAAGLCAQSADKSQAGTYSLLYSFQCSPDAAYPFAGLILDSSGNLYGTTFYGGQFGGGAVFKVTPGGAESVLHSFAGPPSDGEDPIYGSLTLDAAGNVYGTTAYGGESSYGTVFKVTATGTESILYNFCAQSGCTDGETPYGGVARDSAGNLYGTTAYGGTFNSGVVFKLTAGGTESVLHNFLGPPTDGTQPSSNLTRDSSGNLYGTTPAGGASSDGTVFEVTASGTESLLYSFNGGPVDGSEPIGGGLLRDGSGNFYGVTRTGGAKGFGAVFHLTSGGTESVLLSFNGGGSGKYPVGSLARDAAGDLYGTTSLGGSGINCPSGRNGCGVLFGLTTAGKEIVVHDFVGSPSDGATPYGGVVRDPSGNLYGTLYVGGAYGCGAIFKYAP
jgi:uncharacterized repeat protein (TIGR03803 family)